MTWEPTSELASDGTEMTRFRGHMAEFDQWITSNEEDNFETVLNLINNSITRMFFCFRLESMILINAFNPRVEFPEKDPVRTCFQQIQADLDLSDHFDRLFVFYLEKFVTGETREDNAEDEPEEVYTLEQLEVLTRSSMQARK